MVVHSPSPALFTCIMTCHGRAGIVLMLRLLLLSLWVVGGFGANLDLVFSGISLGTFRP